MVPPTIEMGLVRDPASGAGLEREGFARPASAADATVSSGQHNKDTPEHLHKWLNFALPSQHPKCGGGG